MDEMMAVIKDRRSIRRFQDKAVSEDVMNQVLEAVRWSPSWANTQCWEVIVIRNAEVKKKLQETLSPKNPATNAVVDAPILVALCGKLGSSGYYKGQATTKFGDWFLYDLGLANQSLCLAAHDLGLATVIVGLFDHDKAKTILEVPDDYELVTLIPMGYPNQEPPAPKRKEVTAFVHYDRF